MSLVNRAPRNVFFTGKGGVGKTSVACATALSLADGGHRVLLVSTDPASNLDEVLATPLSGTPTRIAGTDGLYALNIDPEAAARAYRERIVGPYRGVLPDASVRSIEEQLSGACTLEIAAFDEFSKLLGDLDATRDFEHILFDTAPTGHTLRLLELPAAWVDFLASGAGGSSCLGPLAGVKTQQALYQETRKALTDSDRTVLVIVSRAERSALVEGQRTLTELWETGIRRYELVLNGLFEASVQSDPTARALEARSRAALADIPPGLAALPRTQLALLPHALVGIDALRTLFEGDTGFFQAGGTDVGAPEIAAFETLLPDLSAGGRGLVMTMGKGGVGKTSVALAVAVDLARRGLSVHLTTTDPAGTIAFPDERPNLRITRIDPVAETKAYVAGVLRTAGTALDEDGVALLKEDLRSPCTEEVAVFRAFARVVHEASDSIVVVDTAPTGHTLLLLDAAEAYHREVLRTSGHAPEEVRQLLPRLRDPNFTRILLVTLPEATPVHEAVALQADLERAGIRPFAWVINQSLSSLSLSDPLLRHRCTLEARYLREVVAIARRAVILPWMSNVSAGEVEFRSQASQQMPEIAT